jgi:hypothetical protein
VTKSTQVINYSSAFHQRFWHNSYIDDNVENDGGKSIYEFVCVVICSLLQSNCSWELKADVLRAASVMILTF